MAIIQGRGRRGEGRGGEGKGEEEDDVDASLFVPNLFSFPLMLDIFSHIFLLFLFPLKNCLYKLEAAQKGMKLYAFFNHFLKMGITTFKCTTVPSLLCVQFSFSP